MQEVLNLVISGIPSILNSHPYMDDIEKVLNLVISGIPSILVIEDNIKKITSKF